jgi:hypothetical protein
LLPETSRQDLGTFGFFKGRNTLVDYMPSQVRANLIRQNTHCREVHLIWLPNLCLSGIFPEND